MDIHVEVEMLFSKAEYSVNVCWMILKVGQLKYMFFFIHPNK